MVRSLSPFSTEHNSNRRKPIPNFFCKIRLLLLHSFSYYFGAMRDPALMPFKKIWLAYVHCLPLSLSFSLTHTHSSNALVYALQGKRSSVLIMDIKVSSVVISPSLSFYMLPSLLVMLTLSTLLWRKWQAYAHKPPGPRGLPVIGHLHLLGSVPHQSLYKLSKVYGPLMSIRLGALPILVASSPTMAKLLLHTHDLAFSGRPRTVASLHITRRGSDVAFAQPDRAWRFKRQLCATQLFSNKRLQALKWIREEEVGALLRSFLAVRGDSSIGCPIVVRPKLVDTTNNTVCRMLFGKRLSEISKGRKEESLLSLLNQAVELLGEFNISDYLPCVAWMDLQGCGRRSKIVADKVRSVWKAIMEERRLAQSKDEAASLDDDNGDLLQVLLRASSLTDDHIMGVLQDMFSAGTDTTAYTIEWALAELLFNPNKLKRAQAEIDKVVGRTRRVQEEDIVELPYLQAVVKETMRLHPVVPLLIPHVASSTCKIMDFHIKAGTQAFVNVWAIGRDPDWWDKPLDFIPERFLQDSTSNVDVRGLHFQLLPFGTGRRTCPGLSLGLISAQTILASLLHCFEWTTPSKPNMSEMFHLMMMMASPLVAFPTPRLPLDCYT